MDSGTSPVDIFKDKIEISYDYNFIYNQDNPFGESNEPEYQKPKPIKISPKGTLQVMDWDTDRYGFMSIADVQKMKADQARFEQARNQAYGGYSGGQKKVSLSEYDKAMVKVDDIKNVEQVKEEIEKMGFYADSYFIDMLSEMNDLGSSLQMFLGIIGAVSLFVAAIGIANTMIMSIYERTREIGVMKVIGASIKDIKRLFLLESSIIGLIGGILGLLLSFFISYMLNKNGLAFLSGITGNLQGIGQQVSVIPAWLSPAALLFASMIGLVSGYLPAKRAMNLSALAALRTE